MRPNTEAALPLQRQALGTILVCPRSGATKLDQLVWGAQAISQAISRCFEKITKGGWTKKGQPREGWPVLKQMFLDFTRHSSTGRSVKRVGKLVGGW